MEKSNRMLSPSLSIVQPYFNSSRFLARIEQNCKLAALYSFEHIVVDDGSFLPHSSALVSLLDKYKCSKYLKLDKNVGPLGARLNGATLSTSKHIIFLDSDDYIDNYLGGPLLRAIDGLSANELLLLLNCPSKSDAPSSYFVGDSMSWLLLKNLSKLECFIALNIYRPRPIAPSLLVIPYQLGVNSLKACKSISWAEDLPWLIVLIFCMPSKIRACGLPVNRWYGTSSRGHSYTYRKVFNMACEIFRAINQFSISPAIAVVIALIFYFRFCLALTFFKNVF